MRRIFLLFAAVSLAVITGCDSSEPDNSNTVVAGQALTAASLTGTWEFVQIGVNPYPRGIYEDLTGDETDDLQADSNEYIVLSGEKLSRYMVLENTCFINGWDGGTHVKEDFAGVWKYEMYTNLEYTFAEDTLTFDGKSVIVSLPVKETDGITGKEIVTVSFNSDGISWKLTKVDATSADLDSAKVPFFIFK